MPQAETGIFQQSPVTAARLQSLLVVHHHHMDNFGELLNHFNWAVIHGQKRCYPWYRFLPGCDYNRLGRLIVHSFPKAVRDKVVRLVGP